MDLCSHCGTPLYAGEGLGLLLFWVGGVVLAGLGLLLVATYDPGTRAVADGIKRAIHFALVLQCACLAAAVVTVILGLLALFIPPRAALLDAILLLPGLVLTCVNAAGAIGWLTLQEHTA